MLCDRFPDVVYATQIHRLKATWGVSRTLTALQVRSHQAKERVKVLKQRMLKIR